MPNESHFYDPQRFRERIFKQNERVMKFGLDAMRRAETCLGGLPHYPSLLIAGTNGKGQISATLSNLAQNAGLRPGLFTSPHLLDFSERIRVNGERLDEALLEDIGWSILDRFGGTDDTEVDTQRREHSETPVLTYFECCLAMALDAFRRTDVNLGVFEVGLGGRLDATNTLEPELSIIASISLDHMQYLGNTIEEIAREKAGIMRANKPVIIGRYAHAVLRKEAADRGCSQCWALGEDFDWQRREDRSVELVTPAVTLPMNGCENMPDYQLDNAAEALFAGLVAHQLGLIPGDLQTNAQNVFSQTRWVGRMYDVPSELAAAHGVKRITLDGAHNQDGVKAFCQAVSQRNATQHALIVNACGDKAIDAMFPQYLSVFDAAEIFVAPISNPRALTPSAYCQRTGLANTQACDSLAQAVERAAQRVGQTGTIYISGSLYLVGEALKALNDDTALRSIRLD